MNWKRVKTILIISLIAINLLLGYFLYEKYQTSKTETLDKNLILNLMTSRNIGMSEEFFDVENVMSNVSLKIQSYDTTKSAEIFSSSSVFDSDDQVRKETIIEQNKALYYNVYNAELSTITMEDSEIEKMGEALISSLDFKMDDVYLKSVGKTHEKTILTYGQKVDGFVLRDSEMIIKYNNENLLEFYRLWYDVIEIHQVDYDYYSPEYVLYKFIGELHERYPNRQRAITIEIFDLVYQLSTDDVPNISNSALEGEASISYRIVTSDKEVYLIQAIID